MNEDDSESFLDSFLFARECAFMAKEAQIEDIEKSKNNQILKTNIKSANKELRTLHLDFGRQTGNTYFIVQKCIKLAIEKNKCCFVFLHNLQMEKHFCQTIARTLERKIEPYNDNIFIYTSSSMEKGWINAINSYAFIDVSCMFGANKIDKIMERDQWKIITLL